MNIQEFRDGIFALRTRRFGTVAEIMIKKIYSLEQATDNAYDKLDLSQNKRVEIKFSTVMKANESTINETNIIDQCLKANLANRAMSSKDADKYPFDCNIQQIKCKEFDILYYGLFFADIIYIFRMNSEEVKNCEGYSDKQHRGNEGEGQFHINNDTFSYHVKNYLIKKMDYLELYNLFK